MQCYDALRLLPHTTAALKRFSTTTRVCSTNNLQAIANSREKNRRKIFISRRSKLQLFQT